MELRRNRKFQNFWKKGWKNDKEIKNYFFNFLLLIFSKREQFEIIIFCSEPSFRRSLITGVKVAEFKDFSYVSSDLETLWHVILTQKCFYRNKGYFLRTKKKYLIFLNFKK